MAYPFIFSVFLSFFSYSTFLNFFHTFTKLQCLFLNVSRGTIFLPINVFFLYLSVNHFLFHVHFLSDVSRGTFPLYNIRLPALSIFCLSHKPFFLFMYVFFQTFHVEHYISLSTRFLLKCFTWNNLLFRFFRSDVSRGTSPFSFHVFPIKHNFFPSFRYSSVNYIGNWITEDSRLLS